MKKSQVSAAIGLKVVVHTLDERPDVTVLSRSWPVMFAHLRHANRKWIVNADGFSPLHREAPLFYGQACRIWHEGSVLLAADIPDESFGAAGDREPLAERATMAHWGEMVELWLGAVQPEVSARLGLAAAPSGDVARMLAERR